LIEKLRQLKEQVEEYRALLFKSNRNTVSEKAEKPGRNSQKARRTARTSRHNAQEAGSG